MFFNDKFGGKKEKLAIRGGEGRGGGKNSSFQGWREWGKNIIFHFIEDISFSFLFFSKMWVPNSPLALCPVGNVGGDGGAAYFLMLKLKG